MGLRGGRRVGARATVAAEADLEVDVISLALDLNLIIVWLEEGGIAGSAVAYTRIERNMRMG